MEKYRKFSDAATSSNPFLPVSMVNPCRESVFVQAVRIGLLSPLLFLRIPLIVISLVLVGLTDILALIPVLSGIIIRPLLRPVACWLALLVLGISVPLHHSPEDFRRLGTKRPTGVIKRPSIFLSSFHGFIDVLVHAVVTRPTQFVFPALDQRFVVCSTVLGAVITALKSPNPTGDVSEVSSHGSVVFLSASPTNGLGILNLDKAFLLALTKTQVTQISAICYKSHGRYGVHHLTESLVSHLLQMMIHNWFVSVDVRVLPEPIVFTEETVGQIVTFLSRLSGSPETQLDDSTYLEFLAYWHETQAANYTQTSTKKKI